VIVVVSVMVAVRLGVIVEVGDGVVGVEVGDKEGTELRECVGEGARVAVSVGGSGWLIVGVRPLSRKTPNWDPAARASTTKNSNQPADRFGLNPRVRKVSMIHARAVIR